VKWVTPQRDPLRALWSTHVNWMSAYTIPARGGQGDGGGQFAALRSGS
jgi:hypothetical protein